MNAQTSTDAAATALPPTQPLDISELSELLAHRARR